VLVIEAYRLVPLFPGIAARGQQVVVQPAALLRMALQEALLLLLLGRVQAVREGLTYATIIA
jgi:hypothetical protein